MTVSRLIPTVYVSHAKSALVSLTLSCDASVRTELRAATRHRKEKKVRQSRLKKKLRTLRRSCSSALGALRQPAICEGAITAYKATMAGGREVLVVSCDKLGNFLDAPPT